MNDAGGMSDGERVTDVESVFERDTQCDRTASDHVSERQPRNQFHHDGTLVINVDDVVNGGDVGVVECRERLRLTLEPRHR